MVHRRDVDKRVKGSMRAGAELANSSKPPHLSTICQAMTTGSTITVIVASFLMAMAVELMMPLLLTVHLFSALVSWLGHIFLRKKLFVGTNLIKNGTISMKVGTIGVR